MSYLSLSRKYRPRQFADMIGQQGATKAISNSIRLGREPHSVIFSGVRGIGKTTMARLFAKALDCDQGPSEEPCGHCESCLAIEQGRHEDVLEIDGASHTGVDDIRLLQETLTYVPQRSKFKVYIIDEVHMLSQSAFNALLKTLEEPPAHVVFVFATTELQKVPETILSRCQVFYLKRLSMSMIMGRIKHILEIENIAYEPQALALIAREGRGSMRDALTFLDQVIAIGNGQVSYEALKDMVHDASCVHHIAMIDGLLSRDAKACADIIAIWDEKGSVFSELVEELAKLCRHAFILRELGSESADAQAIGLAPDELEQLERVCSKAQPLDLNRLFRMFCQLRSDVDGGNLDRYIFENHVFEWCFDPGLPDPSFWQGLHSGSSQQSSFPTRSQVSGRAHQPLASSTPVTANASSGDQGGAKVSSLAERFKQSFKSSSPSSKPQGEAHGQASAPVVQQPQGVSVTSDSMDSRPTLSHEKKNLAPKAHPTSHIASDQMQLQKAGASVKMPATWRALVEAWMREKPLQARILEEAYEISYSPEKIVLAVDESGMVASKLLSADTRRYLSQQLGELFGFQGVLEVTVRSGGDSKPAFAATHQASVARSHEDDGIGPSLLHIKRQEKIERMQRRKEELVNHPLTRQALESFNGKINKVSFKDEP